MCLEKMPEIHPDPDLFHALPIGTTPDNLEKFPTITPDPESHSPGGCCCREPDVRTQGNGKAGKEDSGHGPGMNKLGKGEAGPGGSGKYELSQSAPPALARWEGAIESAARMTGIDANLLGAMVWAESRGNHETVTSNPEDGKPDTGLMQISQSTFDGLGKGIHLDVNNPVENVLAGAMEFATYLKQFGGDTDAALQRYVGANPVYVTNVNEFWDDLKNNEGLPDQDYA